MAGLTVLEQGKALSFSFEDILRYHGPGFPGGVAHGFKVLERVLPLLANGDPPERNEIHVATRFAGPGGRDAIELVTRAVTRNRFTLLQMEDGMTWRNRYFFRFSYHGTVVEANLGPGDLVREEFLALGLKAQAQKLSAEEEARQTWLKQDMADRLMSLPAEKVYDAVVTAKA